MSATANGQTDRPDDGTPETPPAAEVGAPPPADRAGDALDRPVWSPGSLPPQPPAPQPPAPQPPAPQPSAPQSRDTSGEVLTSAHAQARQRAEGGDLTGARTLLEEALAAGELRYGRDHPTLAPLMVDLATIARNVGNLTEAQNQLRRAYGIVVASSGPEHATALSIEGRLAAVTHRLGEPTEAYDWHVADVGARVLGAEHPAVRGAQQRLASAPVHEERTPPTEPPASYEQLAGYEQHVDDSGGWAPGYAGAYELSPREPGVYHRISAAYPDVPADGYEPAEAWPEAAMVQPRIGRQGHVGGIVLVTSLGLAVLTAAVVIATQLFGPFGDTGDAAGRAGAVPSAGSSAPATTTPPSDPATPGSPGPPYGGAGLPPGAVNLRDNGGSVTLTWLDPSGGHVPFIVAGGRSGVASKPLTTVLAGRTTTTIYGLNTNFDYCFTVAAVWSADLVPKSDRICTNRKSTTGPA